MTSCQSSIQNGIKQQGQHLKKVPENKKFQILSNGVFSKPSEKGYFLNFSNLVNCAKFEAEWTN